MLIAQISDLHVMPPGQLMSGKVDTAYHLERAVAHILTLDPRPDLVLATGDLVDAGKPEEYARLRAIMAPLPMPVYVVPGNHDAREALRAAFPEQDRRLEIPFVQYALEEYPIRLIALDTLVPGAAHGELCDVRLDWLEGKLRGSDRPTLLFMHHPPFACGIAEFDTASLNRGADRLGDLVRRNPQVERILCGHVHRPIQMRWAGTLASIGPSTAHQATLDLRPDVPVSFTMDPPAIALHLWHKGGLVTHLSYVGEFDGPHPFG
jgi:3',5'-cyclic-AMP phosphodiesterase